MMLMLATLALVIPAASANWIIGTLIPAITGFLVHLGASDRVKNSVALGVAVVAGVLRQLTVDGADAIVTWSSATVIVQIAVTQFVAYNVLWKPVVGLNEKTLPSQGIGKPKEIPPPDGGC